MSNPLRIFLLPALVTAVLHGALIWAVVHVWSPAVTQPSFKKPEFVKATLVELKTKAPVKKAGGSTVKKVDLTAKKKADAAAQKKRQQQAAAKKRKAEELKAQQLKDRQLKDKQKKAQQEKARQQKAAEQKRKAQEAAAKKRALEEAQQQAALDKALREEQMMLAEQAEAEVVNSYKAIIAERIVSKWSRPPSARRGMLCDLVIQLVPTGKIITVNITKSSGNAAFDRSAEQAVRAVDQIPELQSMDINTFERNFRTIHLQFNPEDLRL